MMDTFVEQLVARRKTKSEVAMIVVNVIISTVITIFMLNAVITGNLGMWAVPCLAIAGGVIFFAWSNITNLDVEYEYAVTNNWLDLDKIINGRKRKRVISCEIRDIEAFGAYRPSEHEKTNYNTRLFMSNKSCERRYYFVINYKEKGRTLVVIEPNEEVVAAIKKALDPRVRRDVSDWDR